ncbi:MAG: threonine/serine exporter family protein, partial [Thermoleophilia bacterium]|nr:threonine/serine exporter family protein [Thermoleophilia bacterium]
GALVGLIAVAAQTRPRLALVAPFAASVTVSTLVLVAYDHGWIEGGPIQLMVPCLFFFIPGDAISAGMLELADGRITAGATRVIYSLAVLLMLAFGALVATVLADVPERFLFDVEVQDTLGFWVVWGGWVIFAVGTMLVFSMRPADFPWALAVLLLTAAVAQLGTRVSGEVIGTFVAAVVMIVVAVSLGRSPKRPPAYALYLGAFYVLTPGSHGLRGFESWLGGHPVQGFQGLSDMLALITALAVGMLVGAAVVRNRG